MRTMLLGRCLLLASSLAACGALQGCNAPGVPKPGVEVPRPDAVLDFPTLYQQNCTGCHGVKGSEGPSYPLANPEYQALVDEAILRQVISQGEPGTHMPAFADSAGGTLTARQINALVAGMRSAWWKPGVSLSNAPTYRATGAGVPTRGQQVYAANCASCHEGAGKAGSITNPDFLALVSDQALRTIIIAGRPDIGQPNWRGEVAGHGPAHGVLSNQDVTDVVAWLGSQRPVSAPSGASAASQSPESASHTGGGQ